MGPEELASFQDPWHDPSVFRLGARTYCGRFSQFLCLDGPWRFQWFPDANVDEIPFWRQDFPVDDWNTLAVPANWETNGYGRPQYLNVTYPFPAEPPVIDPAYCPVGHYVKELEVPAEAEGARVFLNVGAVESAYRVWVNGFPLGYVEDNRMPAEFELTDHLVGDRLRIALEVRKFASGSYLEDQDMLRLGGIVRSVRLCWAHGPFIEHVSLETSFDRFLGRVRGVIVPSEPCEVRTSLADMEATGEEFEFEVPGVLPWSPEFPHLYPLRIALPESGVQTEISVGFRSVTWSDGVFCLNGQPYKLLGVNRHENHPVNGHVVTTEDLLRDIRIIKQMNANCVRSSHYPNSTEWLDLCDRIGLAVISEANIESHGMGYEPDQTLGDNETWMGAHVDRVNRMVNRDMCHPSVLVWSLGNEAGAGRNFQACAQEVRRLDASRPIHYERQNEVADIDSCMYIDVEALVLEGRSSSQKPFFVCEYAHAMGNAMGGLDEYVATFRRHPRLMGGCVWEFADHCLRVDGTGPSEHPDWYWGYGGDWGDEPNDGPFCADGILTADRGWTPKMEEVRACYQPVEFCGLAEDSLCVNNHSAFDDFSGSALRWAVTERGNLIAEGSVPITSLPSLTESTIALNRSLPEISARERIHDFAIVRQDGEQIARGQLCERGEVARPNHMVSPLRPEQVHSGQTVASFVSGLEFQIERAFVDNDIWFRAQFEDSGLARRPELVEWTEGSKTFCFEGQTGRLVCKMRSTLLSTAATRIECYVQPYGELPPLPRVGLTAWLGTGAARCQWFGRGPWESYPDRKASAFLGVYDLSVDSMQTDYPRPQENGNREDVRWLALADTDGRGLMVMGAQLFSFSVQRLRPQDTLSQRHAVGEVPRCAYLANQEGVFLNIDHRQMGLGGASCGPPPPEKHILRAVPLDWQLVVAEIEAGEDPWSVYESLAP